MNEVEPPKIVFPCEDYPIRVMGTAGKAFQEFVIGVFDAHAPDYDRAKVEIRPSRKGNYESVLVRIHATGPEQLSELFTALKSNPHVKMVL